MTATVGYATLQIIPSTKGIVSKLKGELDGPLGDAGDRAGTESSSKFGASFKRGLGAAAKAGAVAFAAAFTGAAVFGKAAVDSASNLSESLGKVNVVFGENSDAVVQWSKTSAGAFGQSQQQALEAAGTYGNLFQAFGLGRKDATEMSTSLVGLAADLASFNNTGVDEALEALRSGLSGETEPLKRYGVAISDARLKDEALRLGLIKTTKDALSPAAKSQAAYALIMQDTVLAQGDFARTSDGLANKQRILAAKFEDMKAKIGKALIPVMLGAVTIIADRLIPAFTDLAEWVIPKVQNAIAAVVAWVKDHWPDIKRIFFQVIDAIVGIWKSKLKPSLKAIWDAMQATFGWLMDHKEVLIGIAVAIGVGLASMFLSWAAGAASAAAATIAATAPIIAIGAAIAAVVAGAIYAYQHFGWFRTAVDAVKDAAIATFGWLKENVPPIVQAVVDAIAAAADWIQTHWETIKGVFTTAIDFIKTAIDAGVAVVQEVWSRFGDNIVKAIQLTWDSIKIVVQTAIDIVRGIIQTVVALIHGDWSGAWDGIKRVVSAAWDGIKGIVGNALEALKNFVSAGLDALKWSMHLAWEGIKAGLALAWDGIKRALSAALDEVVQFFADLPGRLLDAMKGAGDWLVDVGKQIVQGLYNGIVKAPFNVGKAIKDKLTFDIPGIDVPGFASGGTAFGWSVVGEDGPELAYFRQPTQIFSNQQSRAMLRGAAAPAPAPVSPSHMSWPESVTLIVEGEPITARIIQRERDVAAELLAGRR